MTDKPDKCILDGWMDISHDVPDEGQLCEFLMLTSSGSLRVRQGQYFNREEYSGKVMISPPLMFVHSNFKYWRPRA